MLNIVINEILDDHCFKKCPFFQFETNATQAHAETVEVVPQLDMIMLVVVSLVLLERTVKVSLEFNGESGDQTGISMVNPVN